MAIAAGVAASVAVAATAASTAMSATQGGPDVPTLGGVGSADPREERARREQFDILRAGRQYAERGAYEQNLVTPSLYELAGFTPEYDPASFGAAQQARQQADAAQAELEAARAQRDQFQGASFTALRKERLAGLKGKARKQELKQLRKERRESGRRIRIARTRLDTAMASATSAESRAGRITGLRAGRLGSAEEQEFEDVLQRRALDAAKTGRSTDPRLNRELEEEEGNIRARLFRQFGADYENTTAGAMALSAFRQRKSESLADFARKDIGYAGEALKHRATLGSIAAGRMALAQEPIAGRYRAEAAFGDLGARYESFEKMLQADRLQQYQAKKEKAMAEYEADVRQREAITGGLNQLASGASSFGLAAASYGGGGGGAGLTGRLAGRDDVIGSTARRLGGYSPQGPYAGGYQY